MEKKRLYHYYQFGFNYYNLLRNSKGISNSILHKRLKEYFDFVNDLNLSVTRGGIELYDLDTIYETTKKLSEDIKTKGDSIDEKLLEKLTTALAKIDHILDAELWIKLGFILDEKRYSNEILTSKVDKLFAENVYGKLPEIAQEDFKEAGFCLAFDRYTAVAFHALRGTEEVLKFYYTKLLNKPPNKNATWGTYLVAINRKISSKSISPAPSPELMTNLDNLRQYHRNKTQHPVRTYTCDQSQDLIGSCTKAINEIFYDLEKRGLN